MDSKLIAQEKFLIFKVERGNDVLATIKFTTPEESNFADT